MAEATKLTLDAALEIEGSEDTSQLAVRGSSQQTEPLQEWQDSEGGMLACVSSDGRLLVGDVDLETPAALVEVSQDVTLPSALPLRGLSVLGRLSGAVANAITWVAHELQLVGNGGVEGLHAALRASLALENSGDTSEAELRAGDFEAANRAGSSQAPAGKMTGLRGAVVSEAGSYLDEAVALEAAIEQETGGVIGAAYGLKVEDVPEASEGSYAIHTGQGPVHLGDYLELAELSAPGTPEAGLVRVYPKSDGHLYAKDDEGTEYDLTTGSGEGGAIAAKEDGASIVAEADTLDFKDFNVEDLGSGDAGVYHNLPGVFDARLTLETGVPVSTSDQTAETTVYLTPYKGNRVSLYDGTRWKVHTLAEVSIKLTDTQDGALTSSSAVVTGLTDTSQLIAGMEVTGTGIPASTTLSSIDSASQVTLSQNATAGGTQSLTFKVAAGKNLDLFVFSNSGTPKLEMAVWTSDTARATALAAQDGITVKSGAATRRYVGSVRTTATAGQCEDSGLRRFVWSYYNRANRPLLQMCSDSTWTYSTATWRQANASANNQVELLVGVSDESLELTLTTQCYNNVAHVWASVAIGEDSTTTPNAACLNQGGGWGAAAADGWYAIGGSLHIIPTAGYHYYSWLEYASATSMSFNGGYGTSYQRCGLSGAIRG
jgi:hypothetical protein